MMKVEEQREMKPEHFGARAIPFWVGLNDEAMVRDGMGWERGDTGVLWGWY